MTIKEPKAAREAATLAAGYTPGAKDAARLVAELRDADETRAKALTKALMRVPEPAASAAIDALPKAVRPGRARLAALLGQLQGLDGAPDLMPVLVELTTDGDLKTQLNAIAALGRCPGDVSEAALLQLWTPAARPELRRALLRSLGKAGGEKARDVLAVATPSTDPEEQRLLEQARLILARTTTRLAVGSLRGDVPLGGFVVSVSCRAGLVSMLMSEWSEKLDPKGLRKPKRHGDDRMDVRVDGSLNDLYSLRLMDGFSLPLPIAKNGSLTDGAVATLSDASIHQFVASLSEGTPRYRIDWRGGSNAEIWALAQRLTKAIPGWINDPTESLWEIRLEEKGQDRDLALVPRRIVDPRFTYREGDVPAASHPTLAAALAKAAGVKADDVVWDPFVGSGTELIERALLGDYAALYGTDTSLEAIDVATKNTRRAGLDSAKLHLRQHDCLLVDDIKPTLILTNPPMGRRVARGDLKPLLERFVAHAVAQLSKGGRLVWLSPLPDRTAEQLTALGMKLTKRQFVDMGGFPAELQVAVKN